MVDGQLLAAAFAEWVASVLLIAAIGLGIVIGACWLFRDASRETDMLQRRAVQHGQAKENP